MRTDSFGERPEIDFGIDSRGTGQGSDNQPAYNVFFTSTVPQSFFQDQRIGHDS